MAPAKAKASMILLCVLSGSSIQVSKGTKIGQASQEKKTKLSADQEIIDGSLRLSPIHTCPSKNCCTPASIGISDAGMYRELISIALRALNAPPKRSTPPPIKLTVWEKHIELRTLY